MAETVQTKKFDVYQHVTDAILAEIEKGCVPWHQPWSGARNVFGTRNWVQSAATFVPPEWTGTVTGSVPGFRDVTLRDFRPLASSPLRNAGINRPPSPAAFPMPWPLPIVQYDPPLRAKLAVGDQRARIPQGYFTVDIGALEEFAIDTLIGPFELPGSPSKVRRRLPVQTVSPAQVQTVPNKFRSMRLREH